MVAPAAKETTMVRSHFLDADAAHEALGEEIREHLDSLSDSEGLLHALKNDELLRTLTCELMSWVTDPLQGIEARGRNMLLIADRIERHSRAFAERRFKNRAQGSADDGLDRAA
jgi:hypothetical protein